MSDYVNPEMTGPHEPLLPAPDPFSFDEAAWAAYNAQQLRLHWHDMAMPWPLERLREFLQLSDELPAGSTDRWQEAPARVADLRAAFAELDRRKIALDDARNLAGALFAAIREISEDPAGELANFDPDLTHELLPGWLTGDIGAPERWEQPHAAQAAADQEGMDATREYDPDYGKDLDYDDEDQDDGHDYPADAATYDDGYPDDEDEG